MHWIEEKIIHDLNEIYSEGSAALPEIDAIPIDKAIRLSAYLWQGCFRSTNDIWITLCSGYLYKIPSNWLEENIMRILPILEVDWEDDFEYYNLCPVFYHLPKVIDIIVNYAAVKIPESTTKRQWLEDIQSVVGSKEHCQRIKKRFEKIHSTP